MPTKLYVGNLPDSCKEDAIRDLFTSYGDITELAVIKNFAFVHFKHDEDAKNAVRDLNGAKLLGKEITVDVSKSKGAKDKGGDRRSYQRRDYHQSDHINNQNLLSFSGILGRGPPADPMAPPAFGNFGILSAVNTLAAVAEKQRSMAQRINDPFPDRRGERDLEPIRRDQQGLTRDTSSVNKVVSNNSGYVIYERYYVDPKHPLLKGLPLPELPRAPNSQVSCPEIYPVHADNFSSGDANRSDLYSQRDLDTHRMRSPLSSLRDMEQDRNYGNDYRR